MAKQSDKDLVEAHIQKLEPETGKMVREIRQVILAVDPQIGERIKWNNPSFYYTGEMQPFDPKEYKREIAVFNLHKGRVMIVFPSGAKVDNHAGLLEGNYADGRRVTVFKNMEEVKEKSDTLQQVIRTWLSMVEK